MEDQYLLKFKIWGKKIADRSFDALDHFDVWDVVRTSWATSTPLTAKNIVH